MRLRFRRGRLLESEDDKGDTRRRKFKKRGVDDETNGTKSSSGEVALRHQDVQGRKDALGLFNNVIEETASKLVESRKSKFKALEMLKRKITDNPVDIRKALEFINSNEIWQKLA
ncbi:unnamed protein product [Ilex paraguariensis]|uniref:Calmodulin-binding domain-containing protein n=1 Tax=Ilex paraguariensis TaxID=185542 RepID=A0ABC8UY80_9AQUA